MIKISIAIIICIIENLFIFNVLIKYIIFAIVIKLM